MKHKVYILDDHPIVIEGLKKVVDQQEDMTCVGASDDATNAMIQIAKLKPDVVILDITLKDRSGVEMIKKIRTTATATQVLVYSMHEENVYAERSFDRWQDSL